MLRLGCGLPGVWLWLWERFGFRLLRVCLGLVGVVVGRAGFDVFGGVWCSGCFDAFCFCYLCAVVSGGMGCWLDLVVLVCICCVSCGCVWFVVVAGLFYSLLIAGFPGFGVLVGVI